MLLTKKRERTVKTKENKSNEDIITLRRLIDSDKIYLKYDATVIIRTQLSLLNRVTRLILFL